MAEPPARVFDTEGLTAKQWLRLQDECDYEAQKAIASGPVNGSALRWERLYIKCIELRGVKYLGTTDDFPHLKKQ